MHERPTTGSDILNGLSSWVSGSDHREPQSPFTLVEQDNPFLGKDISITAEDAHDIELAKYADLVKMFVGQDRGSSSIRVANRVDISLSVLVNYVRARQLESGNNYVRPYVSALLNKMFASGVGMLKVTYDYNALSSDDRLSAIEVVGEVIGASAQINGNITSSELAEDGGSRFTINVFDTLLHGLKVTRREVESHINLAAVNGRIFAHDYSDVHEKKTFWDYIFGWLKSSKNKRAKKADIEGIITVEHAPSSDDKSVDTLMLDPTDAVALFTLGNQYFDAGNYQAAVGAFKAYYNNYKSVGSVAEVPIPPQFLQAMYELVPDVVGSGDVEAASNARELVKLCDEHIADPRVAEMGEICSANFIAYSIKASVLSRLGDADCFDVYKTIMEYCRNITDRDLNDEERSAVTSFADFCLDKEKVDCYLDVVDLLNDDGEDLGRKLKIYAGLVSNTDAVDNWGHFKSYIDDFFECLGDEPDETAQQQLDIVENKIRDSAIPALIEAEKFDDVLDLVDTLGEEDAIEYKVAILENFNAKLFASDVVDDTGAGVIIARFCNGLFSNKVDDIAMDTTGGDAAPRYDR